MRVFPLSLFEFYFVGLLFLPAFRGLCAPDCGGVTAGGGATSARDSAAHCGATAACGGRAAASRGGKNGEKGTATARCGAAAAPSWATTAPGEPATAFGWTAKSENVSCRLLFCQGRGACFKIKDPVEISCPPNLFCELRIETAGLSGRSVPYVSWAPEKFLRIFTFSIRTSARLYV